MDYPEVVMSGLHRASRQLAVRFATAVVVVIGFALPAQADLDIEEVTSESGVTAWLVQDPSDPMVAISFAFNSGTNQDPKGKEGLVDLMASLLNEGAGDLESDAFQQRFYETGADLSFRAGSETVSGTIRMLADEMEEPLELLRLALTAPRFDEVPFLRERAVAISRLRAESNDPDEQGSRALAATLHGDHPRGRRPTVETLSAIEREDLKASHADMFARSNLFIGVVGNIDPGRLRTILDEVFADLPANAELVDIPSPDLNFGKTVIESYERPQSSIGMIFPGVGSKNPDVYPALLVAEMLGGGGLVSRLFGELRERRGLTYGASAYLDTAPEWGDLTIRFSTRGDQTAEAIEAAREVVSEFVENGPTQEELESAKQYLIGSYAVEQLSSTTSIARTLVGLQRLDRGRDYLERRPALFNDVTVDQIRDMARQIFSVEPTMLIVGPVGEGNL